ncbi:amidinotransferase [Arenivirga flava]|uniref:Amidinotransferase n=1 Tax=Arenivirga flava TaxID=1930060 RepID=A0AA37XBE3_9MICO|nr:amidinotransferase [Arenivirga flava]
MGQAPSAVVLIRPHRFAPNAQTALDNAFQQPATDPAEVVARRAYDEVTALAERLTAEGVTVHLFEDESGAHPDSVFPNNWFSTHAGGHVAVFPMFAPSRRGERRWDVVELLKERYRVQDVIDYSGLERDDVFLEGTGAMVLDHDARIAYVARSHRADPVALERFCTNFGFEPMAFDAADERGVPIYHSNVMLCVGTDVALVGLDRIADPLRRAQVLERLGRRREVIELSAAQLRGFAGNAIELEGSAGRFLAMSARAAASSRRSSGCGSSAAPRSSPSPSPRSSWPADRCAA